MAVLRVCWVLRTQSVGKKDGVQGAWCQVRGFLGFGSSFATLLRTIMLTFRLKLPLSFHSMPQSLLFFSFFVCVPGFMFRVCVCVCVFGRAHARG